jgi:prepilin-type processing-associated H-X9-DG protein
MRGTIRAADAWGLIAIIAGLLAVFTAPFLRGWLWQVIAVPHGDRALFDALDPTAFLILPTLALMAGLAALVMPGQRRRGGAALVLALVAFTIVAVGQGQADGARSAACQSNLRHLGRAVLMYAEDYEGVLPRAQDWSTAVYPYSRNAGIYCCPKDYLSDPKADGVEDTSYCFNAALGGLEDLTEGKRAHVPMLFDGAALFGGPDSAVYRHGGRANVVYLDGGVESVGREEMQRTSAAIPQRLPH